jgi:4-hydroxybenzoate polyprenyltransferase
VPQAYGIRAALYFTRALHLLMLLLLIGFVVAFGLGKLAVVGVVAVALLLAYEHTLVSADDLSKLDAAFFTMNGVIALVFMVFVAADLLLRSHRG